MLLDIHTHHLSEDPSNAVLNCDIKNQPIPNNAFYISVSIHPWQLTYDNSQLQLEWLLTTLTDKRVIAIGEVGLDKLCTTPFDLQNNIFCNIIDIASQYNLPLIIHAVKTTNELIMLKKQIQPKNAWIIHGFRGKKELAKSLIEQGFYLSFGERYNPQSLQSTPVDRLLFETDESTININYLYEQAAILRGVTINQLKRTTQETMNKIFFNC
ncbi:MAG TPA: TatD family hydrolase [Candidatus Phocaeicola gallistercoris]|nr:TatD family hydrolase [Candidatus Phocaeicola gallistercoris]